MGEALLWDDVTIDDEAISEEDISNAENQGRIPAMKFLGTCEDSIPREQNWEKFTGYQANLKWRIDEVLECPVGTPASDDIKDRYEGRFQFDSVPLPNDLEEPWMKNKRLLVAARCGIIGNAKDKIPKNAWSDLIIGARAIVTTEEKASKKDPAKTYINVAFDGYEAVTGATSADSFDDI